MGSWAVSLFTLSLTSVSGGWWDSSLYRPYLSRHHATSRKVVGSIPDVVIEFFFDPTN
jgi:hypothetical protein